MRCRAAAAFISVQLERSAAFQWIHSPPFSAGRTPTLQGPGGGGRRRWAGRKRAGEGLAMQVLGPSFACRSSHCRCHATAQGEEFIEITEDWDDTLHAGGGDGAAPAAADDAAEALEGGFEEEEAFDDDEFDAMMAEMEEIELEAAAAAAPPKKPGMKKGFLLGSSGEGPKNKDTGGSRVAERPAAAAEKAPPAKPPPPLAFAVGEVVERQPGAAGKPAVAAPNAPAPPADPQQRLSKFKLRKMAAGGGAL